jgi:hypothetical protein
MLVISESYQKYQTGSVLRKVGRGGGVAGDDMQCSESVDQRPNPKSLTWGIKPTLA